MYSCTGSALRNLREHHLPRVQCEWRPLELITNCAVGWRQSYKDGIFTPFLQPRKVSLRELMWPNPFDSRVWFPEAIRLLPSLLLPCHTVSCSQPLKLSVSPVYRRIVTQVEMVTVKVCLQEAGVGRGRPVTQTLGAGGVFSCSPPSPRLSLWARGLMLPSPRCIVGWIPIHPPSGCQTHHGERPWRGAVIQRKKPLREF